MAEVVGVRFKKAGKIYWFDPNNIDLKAGDDVIVETVRGIEMGKVMIEKREVPDEEIVQPLKKVVRKATEEDYKKAQENMEKAARALEICKEKVQKHGLPMKLLHAEYTFDNNKLLFYFTAEGRVDFRELVKDLAAVFRTRIELRQIGVRDDTKFRGGLGPCGREVCCAVHLCEFVPISIKMAKQQGLVLNPAKISGLCGRLMCCLTYEQKFYEEAMLKLPGIGAIVKTADGIGEVVEVSLLKEKIKVRFEDEMQNVEVKEYSVGEFEILKDTKKIQQPVIALDDDELKELLDLEE
ncbi:cell fate regulator YaaT (PSP1 superfamily) [Caldicellulosiruptor bescii]|uniref:PSP1 domain protein n=2 Tax=Caldicellulosiruptor bescii TaxID=31899 RepID=B9MNW3_CALBD|nr:stage 0 sporulation family protein [Caldicellulosiruptor bescii]ACM59642.1 PSP1 domain protein [Caldicellulosiruptor bescii DSM 6725]PBC89666.1 cell fate regulator YaaT (PSP1 superfamily) [Caldicellulosiruptor bescii]PBC89989.1 cell fate regulator YaaT (PSP1 superfamily) [Caldicellulosiruptor bescii]PBD04580.1 cell fate regulator YaaT (PSP1 superfamily) [Caldicellulosiruptor bescii]PBD05786.1 cell fate regulator YaaT (PSP1 superfamily) [Caldicellulosiruptor bescii]